MLGYVLNMKRVDLYLYHDKILSQNDISRYKTIIERRVQKEPLQYITGSTEFMSLPFIVNPTVFIPRPETELLVEIIIGEAKKKWNAEEKISIPIILITGFGEIAMAVEALQKGAVDFVEKPFREQALWVKINKALRISDNAFVLDTERKNLANKLSLLTKKESEILKHLLTGKTNNQIANDLDCVRRTVAFHRSNILKRLEISSTVELAQTFCKLNDII